MSDNTSERRMHRANIATLAAMLLCVAGLAVAIEWKSSSQQARPKKITKENAAEIALEFAIAEGYVVSDKCEAKAMMNDREWRVIIWDKPATVDGATIVVLDEYGAVIIVL